jgi:hypothetical protein
MNDFQSAAGDTIAAGHSNIGDGTPSPRDLGPGDEAIFEERMRKIRREKRMYVLQTASQTASAMITWIGDGAHDRLDEWQQKKWDRTVSDPARAMDWATKAVVRCVMAEERLDEDAETRDARRAAEAAERANKAREAERQHAEDPITQKKTLIRRAVSDAYRDAEPDLSWFDRELNLDDLFADLDGDYDEDPVETVARLCARLGFMPEPERLPDGDMETLEQARARTVTLARDYFEASAFDLTAANRNRLEGEPAEEAPAPPARAQGPPG